LLEVPKLAIRPSEQRWRVDRARSSSLSRRHLPSNDTTVEPLDTTDVRLTTKYRWPSTYGELPGRNRGGAFPDDLDIHSEPEYKKEGSDWFALFNPGTKRVLDVSLVHTLTHERSVFSSSSSTLRSHA